LGCDENGKVRCVLHRDVESSAVVPIVTFPEGNLEVNENLIVFPIQNGLQSEVPLSCACEGGKFSFCVLDFRQIVSQVRADWKCLCNAVAPVDFGALALHVQALWVEPSLKLNIDSSCPS